MDRELKSLLIKYGFTLKKSLGQNFLSDEGILNGIVDKGGITENDVVVEIGCGAGTLTEKLAQRAKYVYGYEIDKSLKNLLTDRLEPYDNVEVEFADIMKIPTSEFEKKIGKPYKVVANLPYYITTPILMKFIEEGRFVKSLVIMVQKEVALRLTAEEGTSDYGAITAAVALRGSAEIIEEVPKEKFLPPPKVDSAVVRIDIDDEKFKGVDGKYFRLAVKCGFLSRRKTLANNLINMFGLKRAEAEEITERLGVDKMVRGESLGVEKFVILSEILKELNIK